jgi:hypothetical protein
MSEQAKRAYEAYSKSLDQFRDPDRRNLVGWDDLGPGTQEAWREAVAAAVDEPQPKESLTDVQVRLLEEMDTAKLARKIRAMMPPGRGFLLWTVDYGPGGNIAYVATVSREDSIRTVREWLKHQGAL